MKKVWAKVYNNRYWPIATWEEIDLKPFRLGINNYQPIVYIELPHKWNEVSKETKLSNIVELYVSDKDTQSLPEQSVKIFSGYITSFEPTITNKQEITKICLYGNITRLANNILRDDTNHTTILGVDYPENIANDAITKYYNASYNLGVPELAIKVLWTINNLDPATSTENYPIWVDFKRRTYLEILDNLLIYCRKNWYYYLNENNALSFTKKSIYPKHIFHYGVNIGDVHIQQNINTIKNFILAWDTGTNYYLFQDLTSIALYGKRVGTLDNFSIANDSTTIIAGKRYLESYKDPELKLSFDVLDNNYNEKGYDIESVKPGDTCSILGLDHDLDFIKENMLITSVDYGVDKITVTIEKERLGYFDMTALTKTEADNLTRVDIPDSYVEIT